MSKKTKKELKPSEHKSLPFIELKVDEEQGVVEHLIAIHGVLDHGNDISHPGSFAKTLAERGLRAKVLDKHRTDSVTAVVGKPLEIREIGRDELPKRVLDEWPEATGAVKATTQFLMETPEGKGVFQRIKAGAVDEFSYGYDAITYDHEDVRSKAGEAVTARNLREIKLYEYSPVIWGMNPATGTLSAKGDKGYECECMECGHTMTSEEHCRDIECPECGGEMRRAERPGPGKELVLRCPNCGYETSGPIELDDLLTCPQCGADLERVAAKDDKATAEEWRAFRADVEDDPTSDLSSIHRRFHMWAAQGAEVEGLGRSGMVRAHNTVAAELSRRCREKDPEADCAHDTPLTFSKEDDEGKVKCRSWNRLMAKIRKRLGKEGEPSEEEKVEVGENYIHVPASGQEGKHKGHRIRTITVSESKGIKGRYCGECKVMVSYLFDKEKWDVDGAKAWVKAHSKGVDLALSEKWIVIEDEAKTDKQTLLEMEQFLIDLELESTGQA